MPRPLTAGLASTGAFVALVFVLAELEDVFDNSVGATNRLGVLLVAVAGAVAAGLGYALAAEDEDVDERVAFVAALAPVSALAVLLALLSGADAVTNVAIAIVGPLGALTGIRICARVLR